MHTSGYTESDEISLLLSQVEDRYNRKLRKLISILAGEASAKFSLLLGDAACFDWRVSQLPSVDLVIDYFRWRSEDAHRNALNSPCYYNDLPRWQKRGSGLYCEEYEREAENPKTGQKVLARRRRVRRELELPMKEAYDEFLRQIIGNTRSSS